MFIIDILIYVFFAWTMSSLARQSELNFPDDNHIDKYLKWYIIFFTLITALRYSVGGDYFSYVKILEKGEIVKNRADQEILWNYLVKLNHGLGLKAAFGFGVCAFLQIYFLVKACVNNKYLLVAIPIVMFGSRYYFDMTGAIRQVTAACMFIWFSKYIVERKPVQYFLWVIIASLFHHSALILSVFWFIPSQMCIASKRKLMWLIFIPCFIIGMTPQFSSYINHIQSLVSVTGYDNYSTSITEYLTGGKNEALSFGPIMLSFLLIAIAIIYYGPDLEEKYKDKIPLFSVWYNLSFIFACAYFLVANTGHLFIRPVQYLEFFQMIMAALLLYDLWEQGYDSIKYRNLAIAFIIIIWTSISWDIIKHDGIMNTTTYKSIIFQNL